MLVTVGSRYQIVIPKEVRQKIKGLRPGSKVAINKVDSETISVRSVKKNWLERTRGIMEKELKHVDSTKYLNDLRGEWDKND